MNSEAVEPPNLESDQCERLARRHGLGFHVDQYGNLVPHGYRDEPREASEYELDLWMLVLPSTWREEPFKFPSQKFQPRVLEAEPCEFDGLIYRGNVSLAPEDLAVLRVRPDFIASSDPSELRRGLFGKLGTSNVYVSRWIPKGYFYPEPLERWHPPPGERTLHPSPPEDLRFQVCPLRGC